MGRPVYDVVARRDDIPGLIWGRDYDPNSGLWNGGDYDQTVAKVETHTVGHELIASYNFIGDAIRKAGKPASKGGAKGGSAPKPKGKTKTAKPRSSKSGGKASASRSTKPRTTKSGSTKPGSPAKRRTTAGRSGGARR